MARVWRRQQWRGAEIALLLVLLVPRACHGLVQNSASSGTAQSSSRKPQCLNYRESDNLTNLIPPFALCDSEKEFQLNFDRASERLHSDISTLLNRIDSGDELVRVCFHNDKYFKAKAAMSAWETFFTKKTNVEIVMDSEYKFRKLPNIELMESCDISIVWAVKGPKFFEARHKHRRFPHTLVLEEPLIWRSDPYDSRVLWTSALWDYLNGYSLKWRHAPGTQWRPLFKDRIRIKPWIEPNPEGTVLLVGQVPTDTAVIRTRIKYGSLENAYSHIVESIKRVYPNKTIIYRPHPYLNDPKVKCKLADPKRVQTRTHQEKSLHEELELASLVVTISSTAAIEAILHGVPVITIDPASPIWAVSCHNFAHLEEAVDGHGCRPDRSQWISDMSFSMWTINEIEDGDAFNWLFGYDDWKKVQQNSTVKSSSAPYSPPMSESRNR